MIVFSGTSKLAIQAAYSRVYLFVEGRGFHVGGKDGGGGGGWNRGKLRDIPICFRKITIITPRKPIPRTEHVTLKKLIPKKSVVKKN